MRTNHNQVIIIGAGGSKPYKFPTGEELFQNVQKTYLETARNYVSKILKSPRPNDNRIVVDVKTFIQNIKSITGISLDKYINLNQCDKDCGIHAITIEILRSEQHSFRPGTNGINGDWYKYLFSKMISGLDTYDEIVKNFHSNLVFITFNYDRSLENFLFTNLYNILKPSGHSLEDISSIMQSIPIIHIYGKTGHLEWELDKVDDKVFGYGDVDDNLFERSKNITSMIQLIYDERKRNKVIKEAIGYIEKANRILFCGFGFDKMNLEILGFPKVLERQQIYGTAYNLTTNEIIHNKKMISGRNSKKEYYIKLVDCDCSNLLKDYIIV